MDPRTRPPLVKDRMLSFKRFMDGYPSPDNPDVQWLNDRAFQKED